MKLLILILAIANARAFIIMGLDKYKAIHDKRRISEKNLLVSGLLMGAIGIILGMVAFRHKTQKKKFQICVPILLIINIAIIYSLFYYNII